jgi:hypothetical protein
MDTCPKCGGRIEATVPVYLENVVLDADGAIVGYELGFTWDEEHGGAFDWETGKARLYCENDHDIDYTTVDISKLPKLQLVAKS